MKIPCIQCPDYAASDHTHDARYYTQTEVDILLSEIEHPQPVGLVPIGVVSPWAGTDPLDLPSDWMICEGGEIFRSAYPSLFSILGTTWGSGDGSLTFNVPDLKNRFLYPLNSDKYDVGDVGGATAVQLTIADLPSHKHQIARMQDIQSTTTNPVRRMSHIGTGDGTYVGTTEVGGNEAHENLPPFVVIRYIIRIGQVGE